MIESTANPPTSEFIVFEKELTGIAAESFSVQVRSQDTDGRGLAARFFLSPRTANIDSGILSAGGGGTLPPSDFADTSRILTRNWKPDDNQLQGCYELFWIVSHELDVGDTDCPVDPADESRISWTVLVCDNAESCDPLVAQSCADRTTDPSTPTPLRIPCSGSEDGS